MPGWRLFNNLAVGTMAVGEPALGLDHEEPRLVDRLCFLPLVLLVVQVRLRIRDDRSQFASDISGFHIGG